jgi:hypothetical protein
MNLNNTQIINLNEYSHNAIVHISYEPKKEYLEFLNTITSYDVFVVIDSNNYDITNIKASFPKIKIIQIDNNECESHHFMNTSRITHNKSVIGWDKALYYFSMINTHYKYVWFIEDDVFFNHETTLLNIDKKYPNADLLCNCDYTQAKLNEWLWNRIKINLQYPYFCGMVCCSRLSNALLKCILNYSNQNKTLFFIEALFPTLAKHHRLNVVIKPTEFVSVTYNKTSSVYNKTDIFHPNKDIQQQIKIRQMLLNNSSCQL